MKVVVVGSGLAGVTVAEALAHHAVTLVTAETRGYYSRPRLSHGLALGDEQAAKIVLKPFAALKGVRVLAGIEAWLVKRERRQLVLRGGEAVDYDALVLATGSAASIPPALAPFRPDFRVLNSLDDLMTLRRRRAKLLARGETPRWAVVGGGLIGCEVASDLRKAGDAVTIFHRAERLIEQQLAEGESQALHEHFAALGVTVRYRQDLNELPRGYEGVIVATGFAPRVELAREAALSTARGIVVDGHLRTADPAIHAVGDVAEVEGRLYPFVSPIRSQALWLGAHLDGKTSAAWTPPPFTPVIKIHGFKLPEKALA
ncbi:MAG TPA: FAD-dependent oxidoreductase [Burkholderiales bacterium]|nr:FAD-dependent oxidoreductase [Burkholderiales bacterium]